jgi:hypothetical protein
MKAGELFSCMRCIILGASLFQRLCIPAGSSAHLDDDLVGVSVYLAREEQPTCACCIAAVRAEVKFK